MFRLVPLILLTLLFLGVLALKYLPWWTLPLATLVVLVVLSLSAKRLLLMVLLRPVRAQGRVLRRARVQVHAVEPAGTPVWRRPEEGFADAAPAEDLSQHRFFHIDVTIEPQARDAGEQSWRPEHVRLVAHDTPLLPDPAGAADSAVQVKATELHEEDHFVDADGQTVQGPRRLRFLVAVKQGITRLKFRYVLEQFGEVRLAGSPGPAGHH